MPLGRPRGSLHEEGVPRARSGGSVPCFLPVSSLVHPQRGLCVMSYSGLHETSNLCTFAFGKGAREP
jgi:hypothetical protein